MDTVAGMTYTGAALVVAAVVWFIVGFVVSPYAAAQSLQYMSGLFALAIAALAMSGAVIAVCTGKIGGDVDD